MPTAARLFRWDDIPKETLNDKLDRRLVTGERMMLAHVYLKKGCLVPRALPRERAAHATCSRARCASGWARTRRRSSSCARARC